LNITFFKKTPWQVQTAKGFQILFSLKGELYMSRSHFTVFAELASVCEDREQEFCIGHIDSAIAHLEQTIAVLKEARNLYQSEVPDFVTCDRLDRLNKRTKSLLNMAQGKEVQLPRF
jgi:hypothetical protein